jgi:hypothetical protein
MRRLAAAWALMPALAALAGGCATVRGVSALRDVDFEPDRVTAIRLAGIPVGEVRSADDLSPDLVAAVAAGALGGHVPLDCIVLVRATNPATNRVTARVLRMNWVLLVEGKETVGGVVDHALSIAPGQTVEVPVQVGVDLAEVAGRHAGTLLRLAVALAEGRQGPVDLAVRVAPIVDTPFGGMRVPSFTIPLDSVGR